MISEKTIRNERVMGLETRFDNWLNSARLNGEERREIEDIVDDFKSLIDYL